MERTCTRCGKKISEKALKIKLHGDDMCIKCAVKEVGKESDSNGKRT